MQQIVIFGRTLPENGIPDEKYIRRLETAIILLKRRQVNGIIISGGITQKGFPSEARVGRDYLMRRGVRVPIRLEEEAKTTMENLARTEELLLGFRGRVFIVISESSYERVSSYCEWYFPNLYERAQFVQAGGGISVRDFVFNFPFWLIRKITT